MKGWGRSCDIAFDVSFEDLREACTTLNHYYTHTRYPDTLRSDKTYTREEADMAITCAETALSLICSRIEALFDEEAELWKSPSE